MGEVFPQRERVPRVLVASLLRPTGETGVQTHMHHFLEIARQAGIDAELVTAFDAPAPVIYPAYGAGRLLRPFSGAAWVWWHRTSHFLVLRRALRQRLARGGAAVVYAQDPVSARAALDIRDRGMPIEVVLAVHFNVSQADEWAEKGLVRRGGRLYDRIAGVEREVLPRVDRLVHTSRLVRREIERRIPAVGAVPSHELPNFVARPAPAPGGAPRGDLITIGTLEPRKNQAYLLRVVAAARQMGHLYRLTIVGDGPEASGLRRLAAELNVAELVTFAGYVPDAARLIPMHRAYVHAARMENLPHVVLEAIAAARPVFAPAVGGIPEIVREGEEGRLWPLDEPETAARILIGVLDDAAVYARISAAAERRYETTFAPAVVAPRLLAAVLGRAVPAGGGLAP